ncbi:pif-6 [Cnaphalocrocis medinalis granulovirus]|uniref:Pif-6 n=1 Tax=Cnaphalocrocis medinalis granulovirus TaxID=1750712 RepID=A0A109WZE8_9BBAC|nr:pif-6 [Cnaphalocrocis medinalis granulovirus]AMF83856.1 pif-6 [Cnaphalocrocis medinalis granulovirus]WPN08737.1 pif-6 [Cnaphalocrocis medinalis granulovirus]
MSPLSDAALLDILHKYNWQIIDGKYIEVVPNEREMAWKDLIVLVLRLTPQTYRSNLRLGTLQYFDYKQPIVYDLNRRQLGLSTNSVLNALQPPRKQLFDSSVLSPSAVVVGFILVLLTYYIFLSEIFV